MSSNLLPANPWTVAGRTSQGLEVRGTVAHLRGTRLVFEANDPQLIFRLSEVLDNFRVVTDDGEIATGRAVVTSALPHGLGWLCEVSLADNWLEAHPLPAGDAGGLLGEGFSGFLRQWQRHYTVRPEFKLVVCDLHSLLSHLRQWLEKLELRLHSGCNGDRRQMELKILQQIDAPMVRAINTLHARFEEIAGGLEEAAHPAHEDFCRRLLHPLFLCSPFGHRTFTKPLGYAGDYEMVNMIMRSPYEGPSLFAQAINVWLLRQYPSEAHRNRIRYLTDKLISETVRVSLEKRPARILTLGCGPAHEVQAFLRESALSDRAEITLLDFNQETIAHIRKVLEKARREHGRDCRFHFHKKSVVSLLKEAARLNTVPVAQQYDFIYCAGLFDYLPERTCQQLMTVFWHWLAPGGLLVATNVFPCQPFRQMLEYLLDWRLIYRNPAQMQALTPAAVPAGQSRTMSDLTGTNLLLEARKPA